ncbi:MAG: type II secretion system protein [Armatimonadota bacterium]
MRKNKGFTLVELLIVLTILGILMSIFVPQFTRVKLRALLSSCQMNEKNIATALETYAANDSMRYYPTDGNLNILVNSTPKYINTMPTCPSNGAEYEYNSELPTFMYTITCKGDHTALGVPLDRPQYTNKTGSFKLD